MVSAFVHPCLRIGGSSLELKPKRIHISKAAVDVLQCKDSVSRDEHGIVLPESPRAFIDPGTVPPLVIEELHRQFGFPVDPAPVGQSS